MRRRDFLKVTAGAAAAWPILAHAQTYPSRTITIVVGYAAGGPTDTIARIVAERMRGPLGQPIVVENVSGASGSIGTGRVAHAAPDGYTLSVGDVSTHVFNGATYSLQYNVLKDFEPIADAAKQSLTDPCKERGASEGFARIDRLDQSEPGQSDGGHRWGR